MLDWLKSVGTAVWVGALAFLAFLAATQASRAKRSERKWRGQAEQYQADARDESIHEAENALDRAAQANERAEAARERTRRRIDAIAERDDEMRDIVAGWGADGVFHDSDESLGGN